MDGWIECSKELPDELEAVLVYGISENDFRLGMEVCWRYGGMWSARHTYDITHWRRLPQPPA